MRNINSACAPPIITSIPTPRSTHYHRIYITIQRDSNMLIPFHTPWDPSTSAFLFYNPISPPTRTNVNTHHPLTFPLRYANYSLCVGVIPDSVPLREFPLCYCISFADYYSLLCSGPVAAAFWGSYLLLYWLSRSLRRVVSHCWRSHPQPVSGLWIDYYQLGPTSRHSPRRRAFFGHISTPPWLLGRYFIPLGFILQVNVVDDA